MDLSSKDARGLPESLRQCERTSRVLVTFVDIVFQVYARSWNRASSIVSLDVGAHRPCASC